MSKCWTAQEKMGFKILPEFPLAHPWLLNQGFPQVIKGSWGKYRKKMWQPCLLKKSHRAITDSAKCACAEWNNTPARNKPFHFKAVHFSNHKARVPVASERIWALNAFLPFIHGTDDFIQDDTPLQQFRGFGRPSIWKTEVSLKAQSRSIVRIGEGDWAMKTYAFLGLIVFSQLPLSLPPSL